MNQPSKVAPDKRGLIAEVLLAGGDSAAVRRRLVESGISSAAADYEIRRAEKDPLFRAALRLRRDLAKSHWVLRNYRTLDAQRAADSVPTIDKIVPERFFADFYYTNRPVKLTGLVDHWPALKLWTPDYMAEKVGDAVVELQGQRESAEDYEMFKQRHQRQLPMREVVEAIRGFDSTNEFYITAYNDTTNKRTLAPLWDDLGPVSILRPTGGLDGFFWFGPKGTLTPLHHDLTNNLLVQVLGRKRVLMVPPWELERVRNHQHCFSAVTLAELQSGGNGVPDVVECVIGPGEAVFLPVGWWHHVEALDVSISMSFTNFPVENDFTPGHPVDPPPAS
jgi:hypothetical protein